MIRLSARLSAMVARLLCGATLSVLPLTSAAADPATDSDVYVHTTWWY